MFEKVNPSYPNKLADKAFHDSIPAWEDSFMHLLKLYNLVKSTEEEYEATKMNDKMLQKKLIDKYEHRIIEKMCYRISFFLMMFY